MHTYIHKIKIKGKEPIYLKVGQGGVLAEREWKEEYCEEYNVKHYIKTGLII